HGARVVIASRLTHPEPIFQAGMPISLDGLPPIRKLGNARGHAMQGEGLMPADAAEPVSIPPDLWERPEMLDALQKRNIGQVFRLVRQYAGVSPTRISNAVNLSQGKVSEIMRGTAQGTALEVFERIADGLRMPDSARLALGLAPSSSSRAQIIGTVPS